MRRTTSPKISKETISTYAAHSENGQFIIDYLSSLIVYEYDDTLLWKSSFQRFDESGSLAESTLTKRKAHPKGYIYERYNHNGELDGYIICDKNGFTYYITACLEDSKASSQTKEINDIINTLIIK